MGANRPNTTTFTERTVATNVSIEAGDQFAIAGVADLGELAAVDYLEFIPVVTQPQDLQSYADANQGVFANLEQGVGFVPDQNITEPVTVLPLGDSITFGVDGEQGFPGVTPTAEQGGYRTELWNLFQDLGLPVDFVGPLSNGPDSLEDRDHAGFPGARTSDLINGGVNRNGFTIDGINAWLNEYEPDALLVMSGANNASNDIDVSDNMFDQIERLVRRINALTDNDPNYNDGQGAELILSTITPIDPERQSQIRADNVEAYNQLIRDNIVNDPTSNIDGFVDIGNAVTVNDLAPVSTGDNGLHPTQATYDLMAELWYEEVLNALGRSDDLSQVNDLIGSSFNDILAGDSADNRIQGGSGNDELTGNGGADTFAYEQLADGGDVITDFDSSGGDRLEISTSGFGNVLTVGTLSSEQFALGTSALDGDDYFVYDRGTGNLLFDIDGNGTQTPTLLATFEGNPLLSANQFSIIS
ncbi:MAG: GDSL-type esterase/lipase family protein [Cyanobacteriota bacterium]|nr:GDSL-type esterase/lipase family protein [Cyanobacteriota bacterium]